MTPRERLHVLVDEMDDEQAERALRAVEPIVQPRPRIADPQRHPLPEFVGSFDSGHHNLSQRVDELLDHGFGR